VLFLPAAFNQQDAMKWQTGGYNYSEAKNRIFAPQGPIDVKFGTTKGHMCPLVCMKFMPISAWVGMRPQNWQISTFW